MPDSALHVGARVLTELLRAALDSHVVVHDSRVIRQEMDYAVLEVAIERPELRVVVKLAGRQAELASDFDRTAAIVRLVREHTSLPTFEVLACDASYRTWPWRYIVMTSVPGVTWQEAWPGIPTGSTPALYAQLGQAVAQLQGIRFPVCGEIGPDGAVIDGAPFIEAFARRARRRIADPDHANLFVALLQQRAALFSDVPAGVLAHEDLNPTNLLVLDDGAWRLSSILDFDSAWVGTAESDLARLELWRGMTGEGFHQAYEAIAPIAPGYRHRRALYQLLWCLEFASPSAQHHADTARVCAELGIAPITFF